jgi:hypothetical protein
MNAGASRASIEPMRRLWIALVALTTACGTSGPTPTQLPMVMPTLPGVGFLPNTIPAGGLEAGGLQEPLVVITRPVNADGVIAQQIGELVGGNRLLMIGDSIFAGTESRHGGEMCAGLNSLGWTVEVAAEVGRFVEFGVTVARRLIPQSSASGAGTAGRSDDDWDAVAVFLGSNYDGDQGNYDARMRQILDRAAPRPILLYTVTEYRTDYSEVTAVINQLVEDYQNATLIDWAQAARTPGVLRPDGLHPGNAGEQVLVDLTGAALGRAPDGEVTCIESQFSDDSSSSQGNGTPNTDGSSSGGGTSSGSTTTTIPGSTTTIPGSTTTIPGSTTTIPGSTTTTTGG